MRTDGGREQCKVKCGSRVASISSEVRCCGPSIEVHITKWQPFDSTRSEPFKELINNFDLIITQLKALIINVGIINALSRTDTT
jgi:hypothetical protein